MDLPLSMALYDTDATCVTFYLLRDMPYVYDEQMTIADDVTTTHSYKSNAVIQNVPKDLRFEKIECVAELDFANMYATVISVFNISPEYVTFKENRTPGVDYRYFTVNNKEIGIQ